MTSTITAKGLSAESMKANLARRGVKGLRDIMQEELRIKFPKIEIQGELELLHNAYDHFELRFSAIGDEMIFYSEDDRCHVYPAEAMRIVDAFPRYHDEDRTFPMALSFPCSISETFQIYNSRFRRDQVEVPGVVTPYFQASATAEITDGMMEANYFFETLKDEIPASAFPTITARIDEAFGLVVIGNAIYVDSNQGFRKSGTRRTSNRSEKPSSVPESIPLRSAPDQEQPQEFSQTPTRRKRRSSSRSHGPPRTSGYAISSLVAGITGCLFFLPFPFAIIFGHIAHSKIKHNPSLTGGGMAIAGLVMGYIILALFIFAGLAGFLQGLFAG